MADEPETRQTLQTELARLRRRLNAIEKAEAERTQVEQALRRQAALLQEQAELLDLAHDTIMVRDLGNRILFWNRGAEEIYGWSRQEALGQVTHSFLHTKFPQPLPEIEARLLSDRRWEGELIHTRKDGTSIVVASRWALRCDQQGKPLAILEINNNITSRMAAEDALRQTLEQLDHRVQERTADLMAANAALTEEVAERGRIEQELMAKTQELNEVNSALQVLLKQQERYRADMEDQILANARTLILPYLEALLTTHLTPDQRAQAEIAESNLRNLVSRFTRRLSAANLGLTPKELQIANLIRDGRTTKEIAELLRLSPRGVVFHRQNIRQKLGLQAKTKRNLRIELLSLA